MHSYGFQSAQKELRKGGMGTDNLSRETGSERGAWDSGEAHMLSCGEGSSR